MGFGIFSISDLGLQIWDFLDLGFQIWGLRDSKVQGSAHPPAKKTAGQIEKETLVMKFHIKLN